MCLAGIGIEDRKEKERERERMGLILGYSDLPVRGYIGYALRGMGERARD